MFFKKKIDPKTITHKTWENSDLKHVGRLYLISLHNCDLQRIGTEISSIDLARFFEALGLIEIVDAIDENEKIGKYYLIKDKSKLKNGSIRNVMLEAIDKIKPFFRDKELKRIADNLSYLDTTGIKKCS